MNGDRRGAANPAERTDAEFTLRALRVFVAVEEAGSMAVAAERLRASPSAVSQQISNLENALAATLFDRAARPISLTPAGQLLSRHAHRILNAVSDARAELVALNLSALPELRLAIIDDLDASVTPDLVAHLQATYPDTFVSVTSGNSIYLTDALVNRDADIVLTGEPPKDDGTFLAIPVLSEPYVLVGAKGVFDGDLDVIDRMHETPFVQCNTALPMGRRVAQQLKRVRFSVPQRFAFEASRSVLAMVRKSGGWTLMTPLPILDSERFLSDLDVLPLPFPGFSRTVYLAARRDELGNLPARLAARCQDMIESQLFPRVIELAPWTEGTFRVLRDELPTRQETSDHAEA